MAMSDNPPAVLDRAQLRNITMNDAVGLRSMAARYLFLDEVDGYPGDTSTVKATKATCRCL